MKQGTLLQILGHQKDNQAAIIISYGQLGIHESNNVGEMNKFIKNYKPPKLNQDEINYLNSPITISKIGVNQSPFPPKKSSWSEEVASILYNFFLGNRRDRNISQLMLGSYYYPVWYPNPGKTVPKRKRERTTDKYSLWTQWKKSQQNVSKVNL